jgi:hypothetical protein
MQAVGAAQAAWRALNVQDLTGSWNAGLAQHVKTVLAGAQVVAASGATSYVSAIIADQHLTPDPAGKVNPLAFSGRAADGRSLDSLLYLPIIDTKQAIGLGVDTEQAMLAGLATLLTYVDTEVGDASRAAAQVASSADQEIIGYVRYLDDTACDRCIVLAGRLYRHNEGFERHPQDGCTTQPVTRSEWDQHGDDVEASPAQTLAGMTDEQLAQAGLSQADVSALRDGADPAQVINAHRGVYTAGDRTLTREGTTSSGLAGQRMGGLSGRPTTAQIYRDAGDDRETAVGLLRQYGYLI